ncbi:MAG TPA: SagB/ThcOx family dehydrogenase [Thermotogota bacterium]|nr:SagB/ThcOx family dehydrogenase [Thermotogota bacterium]HPJ90095.1 SagB/ThcOx family dehydrogenase [Thermotogota bacterium]HPR97289.1 SagB/ThcOx family dehydrogenase [Thermotogota bacterium]
MEKMLNEGRDFIKSNRFEMLAENVQSDQEKGVEQPPLEKPLTGNEILIDLPDPKTATLKSNDFFSIINNRESRRLFANDPISLEQLSYLLWATQGVKNIFGKNYATKRTVPSAGARHPFETYLWVKRVEGLKRGIYRYTALHHKLMLIKEGDFTDEMTAAAMGQKMAGDCACTFVWALIPYRGEWRYHVGSHKTVLLDAGHICQNLYLACEAEGLGTCAIAAYFQKQLDSILGLDGEDEFAVYLSPVGIPKR